MTNFTPRARSCSSLFGGENARDAGEVVGYGYVCPGGGVEKRLDGREAAVTEFEDKEAGGFEMRGGLSDEISIEFVTFYGGEEGYEFYADLITQSAAHLKPAGLLVLELGHNSLPAVQPLLDAPAWTNVAITNDLSGIPRVLAAERL